MRLLVSERASQEYNSLPQRIQALIDKQFRFLLRDRLHPSLHAKKYDEARRIWQARVDRNYRFYFTIDGDVYRIWNIIKHPK